MIFGHQNDTRRTDAAAAPGFDMSQAQPSPTFTASAPAGISTPQNQPVASAATNPLATDPDTGAPLPVVEQDIPHPYGALGESVLNQPTASSYGNGAVSNGQSAFANDPAPTSPFGDSQPVNSAQPSTPPVSSQAEPAASHLTPSFTAFSDNTTSLPQADPQATQTQPATDDNVRTDDTSAPSATPVATSDTDDLLGIRQQALGQLGPLVSHLDQSPEEKFRTTMMLIQSTDNPSLLHDAYAAAQAIPDEKTRAQALLDVVNEINYFTQSQSSN